MSARAQLQASGLPAKPVAVATLQPEGVSETNRCVAVAWVPRSESGQFIAAYNTGNIYVYKKVYAARCGLEVGLGGGTGAGPVLLALAGVPFCVTYRSSL